jgi:hypothetical protein
MYQDENFCVVSFELFLSDPLQTLQLVSRFVGLRDFDWHSVLGDAVNISRAGVVCERVQEKEVFHDCHSRMSAT